MCFRVMAGFSPATTGSSRYHIGLYDAAIVATCRLARGLGYHGLTTRKHTKTTQKLAGC